MDDLPVEPTDEICRYCGHRLVWRGGPDRINGWEHDPDDQRHARHAAIPANRGPGPRSQRPC